MVFRGLSRIFQGGMGYGWSPWGCTFNEAYPQNVAIWKLLLNWKLLHHQCHNYFNKLLVITMTYQSNSAKIFTIFSIFICFFKRGVANHPIHPAKSTPDFFKKPCIRRGQAYLCWCWCFGTATWKKSFLKLWLTLYSWYWKIDWKQKQTELIAMEIN